MENENIQALAKQNERLQTEIESHLTLEEKEELQECEYRIQKAKELIENAYLVIAQELSKIRAKKLYREKHKTFAEYIKDQFSFTREYGQNLAQIGDFVSVANEALKLTTDEISSEVNLSINAINEMIATTNRLGKYLGLGNSEFNILKPIINNSIKIMIESAPRAKDGVSPNLIPRIVTKFYEALNDSMQERIVEIEGEAITIAEAKEKNLLNYSTCEEVISQIAEQILEDSEDISLRANYKSNSPKTNSESEKNITSKWRSAELLAKEHLELDEDILEVEDVSESNLGYDLKVIFKSKRKIYVEVKKVRHFNQPFNLTNNEFSDASHYGNDYYIALVIIEPFQIKFISNPTRDLDFTKRAVSWVWQSSNYTNNLQEDL